MFWDSFEKTAARGLDREDIAEATMAASGIGTLAGNIGAYFGQKYLGKKLMKGHGTIPMSMMEKDVKNWKGHFAKGKEDLPEETLGRLEKVLKKKAPRRLSKALTDSASKDRGALLKEIGELGESFIKDKKLRESGIKFNVGFGKLSDYYNPVKNTVNVSTSSPAVALHEMGHAADYRGSLVKSVARNLPMAAGLLAVPTALAYGEEIKEKIPGTVDDKVISFLQEHPVLAGLGGYTSATLYPEGKASYLALKHIKKERGSKAMLAALKKTLGPAFGTYLLGALPIAAGFGAAKWMSRELEEKYQKKKQKLKAKKEKELSKAAGVTDSRAFWAGFAGASIPTAAASYWLYGSEGGKVKRDMDKRIKKRALVREYGSEVGNRLSKYDEKLENILAKYPPATAAAVGGTIGIIGGLITHVGMKDMDILKKIL